MCLHPLIRLLHVNSHSEEQQIVIKKGRSEECEMKFVTYNVNGLRQRVSQHGSLLKLLNSLDADIICFQETKLQKYDLSVDVTMAEGYEAFFSCTRTSSKGRLGYSGVATFCRVSSAFSTREVALPIAAEEGLTGLLRQETVERGLFIENLLAVDGIEYMTKGDQLKVDSEGRCIITDHGHFVLFNLYGPRADGDDEERTHFKFLFYKLLERRWESLLAQGKRVIVVGDLNIAPSAIDRCDAEPEFEKNKFRAWLRSMLRESGGYFVDVFRSKHPSRTLHLEISSLLGWPTSFSFIILRREGAYTCFSPRVGAEEFNYGSRIDHILIAGPCLHENHVSEKLNLFDCHVVESDIMIQFLRGNSVERPKWKGGRSIKLEGSDHVPVYMVLTGIPDLFVHNTPSLAVRYIPEVHGWQQTIVPFLKKRKLADTNLDITHPDILTTDYAAFKIGGKKSAASLNNSTFLKSNKLSVPTLFDQLSTQTLDHTVGNDICAESNKPIASDLETVRESSLHRINMSAKKVKRTACSQLTLRSFFHKPKLKSNCDAEKNTADESFNLYCNGKKHDDHFCGIGLITFENSLPDNNSGASITSRNVNPQYQPDTCSSCSSGIKNRNIALLEWQRIQQKMKMSIPLCKGHGEPCVARSVKKKGPNIGRKFYICARAQGPAANSEANCGHFEWVTRRSQPKKNVSL